MVGADASRHLTGQDGGGADASAAEIPVALTDDATLVATDDDLNEITRHALKPLSLFVIGGYSVLGIAHFFLLPPDIRTIMTALAAASVVSAALIYVLVKRGVVTRNHANWLMQYYGLVLLANSATHMVLSGEDYQAVNIGLIIACLGLFHLCTKHFWASYAVVLGTWFAVMEPMLPTPLALHYDFYLFNSTIVATIAFLVRRRAHSAAIRSQKQAVAREQATKQAMKRARIAEIVADHERAKQEFISNMSHELRTPLNAIIGFSEILDQEMFGPLGSDQNKDYVKEIHGSGQKLLTHLNDLLELSSISLVDDINDESTFHLDATIQRAVEIARARQHRPCVTVHVEDPGHPVILYTEERLLKNALIHLFANAIKFNKADGRVDVSTGITMANEPYVSVADTGRGMTQEQQRLALQPFWQHEGALSRDYEGIGLGLSITSAMADRLNARLEFRSEPGCGTTVTIYLPPESLAGRDAQADDSRAIA